MHVRDWLFSLETLGIKLGLLQISRLLDALGHPERAYPSITVAGTNGKGSVTAMVERGLRAAGRRTGRYTSPHLVNIEERIAIDGQPISAGRFDQLAERVREGAGDLDAPPSFFEATTALALLAFQDAGVDVAVLEVGLGGRLDATNAVDATLVAITAVDLDHQEYLGDTLTAIAREKAGIIKAGVTVITSPNPAEVMDVIRQTAADAAAHVIEACDGVTVRSTLSPRGAILTLTTPVRSYGTVALSLAGRHQVTNAVTAVRVLESVLELPASAIMTALSDVVWPARLEWITWRGHDLLIDGAHNPAGAATLASFLMEMIGHPVPIVVGVMRDKAGAGILQALAPVASHLFATAAPSPRAMTPATLSELCRTVAPDVPVTTVDEPLDAVTAAMRLGEPVVIAGSLYLAGYVRGAVHSTA